MPRYKAVPIVKELDIPVGVNDTYGEARKYEFGDDEVVIAISAEITGIDTANNEVITIGVTFYYEDGTDSGLTEFTIDTDGFYYLTEYFMTRHLNKPIVKVEFKAKSNLSSTNATVKIYLRNYII